MIVALILAASAQGFVGSLHCIGMCGPFVHVINATENNRVLANVAYHFGRTSSYIIVGLILGSLGQVANAFLASGVAAAVGAIFIVYFGLSYIFPQLSRHVGVRIPGPIARFIARHTGPTKNRIGVGLLIGGISGLLPCGLLFPAYALALATGNALQASLVMFAFSIGTIPALLFVAGSSGWLWNASRGRRMRIAMGVLMILVALGTIAFRFFHSHSHDSMAGHGDHTEHEMMPTHSSHHTGASHPDGTRPAAVDEVTARRSSSYHKSPVSE